MTRAVATISQAVLPLSTDSHLLGAPMTSTGTPGPYHGRGWRSPHRGWRGAGDAGSMQGRCGGRCDSVPRVAPARPAVTYLQGVARLQRRGRGWPGARVGASAHAFEGRSMTSVLLLALRAVVGGLLAGHGAQKLFGWFGGHGLEGTAGWLEFMRLRAGAALGRLARGGGRGGGR